MEVFTVLEIKENLVIMTEKSLNTNINSAPL